MSPVSANMLRSYPSRLLAFVGYPPAPPLLGAAMGATVTDSPAAPAIRAT